MIPEVPRPLRTNQTEPVSTDRRWLAVGYSVKLRGNTWFFSAVSGRTISHYRVWKTQWTEWSSSIRTKLPEERAVTTPSITCKHKR